MRSLGSRVDLTRHIFRYVHLKASNRYNRDHTGRESPVISRMFVRWSIPGIEFCSNLREKLPRIRSVFILDADTLNLLD